jgi:hypothetical protein
MATWQGGANIFTKRLFVWSLFVWSFSCKMLYLHKFFLPMTTPKSNPSKHYKHFRKAVAFAFRKLELCRHCRFRAGSFSGLSSRIQVLAHTPCWPPWSFYPESVKQLRLLVVNETRTNSYTGPRLDFPKSAVRGSWKRRTFVTRKRAKFTVAFLLRWRQWMLIIILY